MEVHPLQSFPSSETGRGLRPRKANEAATAVMMMEVKKEVNRPEDDELSTPVLPSINLGLQIGTNSAGSRNERTSIARRSREPILTAGQLQELEQQVLIYKYLAAGLRVPTHLLVPIWKSAARILDSNVSGVYERYSSFIGFSPVGFDYRSMMDPEPGRCRRTDGKKWRCSRKTVPQQKYCERHMHRGRQRSRKPVEASENDSPSKKIILNNPDRDVRCTLDVPTSAICGNNKTKNHLSCNFTTAIPFLPVEAVVPGPKTVSDTLPKSVTETITGSMHSASAIVTSCADATKTIRMVPVSAPNTTATCITTVPSINPTATTSIPTSYIVDLKDACNMNFRENCSKSRNNIGRNDPNIQKIASPGLGFSPNSVLQVPGCSSSLCDSKINLELEPGRCRRTDGKKWRCRRDVIPNQKYCALHMHRGSKKHLKPFQNAAVLAPPAATYGTMLPLVMTPLTKLEPATPNTNLSMSIQADNKGRHTEARSNVSSSSETTITDTTITA
ncbi:growth-regulating factor 9 [Benincasa hispida]|uniref:growth-regulating factor 9 n=1 Tax=Benincasa hispida TaxID=102211 RepID=UPI0018FF6EA3|nr:growth-regulating factor 9 [Benincasa hispida]XP_038902299.1 growth-regulating factor 9 [Benincasa hispida]